MLATSRRGTIACHADHINSTTRRTGRTCPLTPCACSSAYLCLKTVLCLEKTCVSEGCKTKVAKLEMITKCTPV
eukprot:6063242-Alexandrium_andersonii.AAC.1